MQQYNIFFLHEWQIPEPVYYFVDQIEADSPLQLIQDNLPTLAHKVRKWLEVDENDLNDDGIKELLYVVPSDAWTSSTEVYRQSSRASFGMSSQ